MAKEIASSKADRICLFLLIALLPFQDQFKNSLEISFIWFMFLFSGLYVLCFRLKRLEKALFHPIFVTLYILLLYAAVMEAFRPYRDFSEIIQILQMGLGGAVVAALVVDWKAVNAAKYAYLLNGVWLSIVLFFSARELLSSVQGGSFTEASNARVAAMSEVGLKMNWNSIGFAAAQASAVALLGIFYTSRDSWKKWFFLACGLVCLLGVTVSMSRGGLLAFIIVVLMVLKGYGIFRFGTMLLLMGVGVCIFLLVPPVALERFTSSAGAEGVGHDSRWVLYQAAYDHWNEYVWHGIGRGNFWTQWGHQSQFRLKLGRVAGAHNAFLQLAVYWGIAAAALLGAVCFSVYRHLPRGSEGHPSKIFLQCILATLMLLLMLGHNLYTKEISFGLGLVVGYDLWIRESEA